MPLSSAEGKSTATAYAYPHTYRPQFPAQGSGQGCPLLRASNEHCFIVRVLRARRAPGRTLLLSKLARFSLGMGLNGLLLRAFNEGSPRPRVARAQKIISLHPFLEIVVFFREGRLIGLPLRASTRTF